MVKAMFVCSKIEKKNMGYDSELRKHVMLYNYEMEPIPGDAENQKLYGERPEGKFTIFCVKENLFEQGKEYVFSIEEKGAKKPSGKQAAE